MSKFTKRLSGILALLAVGVGVALAYTHDPELANYRDTVTLEQAPTGSVTIEAARKEIDSTSDVVLTVRIGARDVSQWWQADSASFFASEATEGSHYNAGEGHDPTSCPFCRRKWKVEDSMVLVHLVDADGNQIPVSAPDLLNLKDGDIVVVRGKASVGEDGFLVVNSGEIFLGS
ncbi:MAG: hypothetical protein AB8G99_25660 [Planctomycetaceae bacterium]